MISTGPSFHTGKAGLIGITNTLTMLMTIAIVLILLWILGLVSSYTIGGLIHILLVIAVVLFLVRVIQGRNPLG